MTDATRSAGEAKPAAVQGWSEASVVFGVSLLILGIAFWTSYSAIVAIWWRSETFAHGFLIVPIVCYLIWQKRVELAQKAPRPSLKALIFMFGMAVFWLLGYVADVVSVEQLAAVAMVPALAWSILGTAVVRCIIFPLGYLFFAVPIGDFLVPHLQDMTAIFSVWALQMTGIPVYWEGRFFHIPTGSFEVAEACSGVRYLIASLALGSLYAYLNYTSLLRRLLFIAISAVVPIIANSIRAYGIVMIAHLSEYKLAVGVDHLIYGWLFFGVVILFLFWVGSLFREQTVVAETAHKVPAVVATGQAVPVQNFVGVAVLATGLALSAPGLNAWLDAKRATGSLHEPTLPTGLNGWSGPHTDDAKWKPRFVGALQRRGEYRKDDRRITVYLAYYPIQTRHAELISWQNRLYDDTQSRQLGEGSTQARLPNGHNWPVHTTRLQSADGARLVWHWYDVHGTTTISRVLAKVYELQGRLSFSQQGSAAWLMSANYELTPSEAQQDLTAFLADMLPALRETVVP